MKYISTSIAIILLSCVSVFTAHAQSFNFQNSAQFYLLKPSDKNIGVKLGVSPDEFKKVFGNPTTVTNEYIEEFEESVQKLKYKSCDIIFTKNPSSTTYRLTRFDLKDGTIGFGEKGKYVLVVGDKLVDVIYPENHPMHPRVSHQLLKNITVSSYIKKKSNKVDHYIQSDLKYNGTPTDSQLIIDFRINTITSIFIEDAP